MGGVREESREERGTEDGMLLVPRLSRGEEGREAIGVTVGSRVGGVCLAGLAVMDL